MSGLRPLCPINGKSSSGTMKLQTSFVRGLWEYVR